MLLVRFRDKSKNLVKNSVYNNSVKTKKSFGRIVNATKNKEKTVVFECIIK